MSPLRATDLPPLAARGLRGHPLRFLLSALGVAIGVAAMLSVLGISQSSQEELSARLAALGTNLLRVVATDDVDRGPSRIPATAGEMLRRIGPVDAVSSVGELEGMGAYRSPYVPSGRTSSVVVAAVDPSLVETLRGDLAWGHWFSAADSEFPTAVLGSAAASRLGIEHVGTRLWVDGRWVVVVGALRSLSLAPELDPVVMLPADAAATSFGWDRTASSIYMRSDESQVRAVTAVVPSTASVEHPELIRVERPSDLLEAKLAAESTGNSMLLGLALVSLLVGGVGISNTMIIAVIERRSEIGMRRALGATRTDVAVQFLSESLLMSLAGGVGGVAMGYLVTAFYARGQGWGFSLPWWQGVLALVATAMIGTAAGLYPAVKASRESPVAALSAP